MMKTEKPLSRPDQLTATFKQLIDQHLDDLVNYKEEEMFEIERFANLMFIHPSHLSNTIKESAGVSACEIYQLRILATAKKLLEDPKKDIREIAFTLSFEPTQFTKWFKRFTKTTPSQYRKIHFLKS